MLRKVFRAGNSCVISLPKEALEFLGIGEGAEVSVDLDKDQRQLIITPTSLELAEIDETFVRQVNEFIERYRPALIALAK